MENQINVSNSKRNKIFQIVIPIIIAIIIGIFIYILLGKPINKKTENKSIETPTVNATTPNRPINDSFLTKQEVYTAASDENNLEKLKKEEFNKGSDKFSKLNTNVTDESDTKSFQRRLKNEVVPSEIHNKESVIPFPEPKKKIENKVPDIKTEETKSLNTDNDIRIKKGFNSFTMKKGSSKESNSNTTGSSSLQTYQNPAANNSAEINCLAVVSSKSKITSHGSITITLSDNLPIAGDIALPSGTNIAAKASVMEDRVMLEIESANINGKIVRIALKAYDLDGMEGLFVKNSKLQKSASSSANSTLSNVSSIGENLLGIPGQLAGGIIRGLAGNGSNGSVTLPEGYKMILKSKY